MRQDVLQPRVVGVVRRRDAVAPASVALIARPVLDVEGRVGENGVSLQPGVQVARERVPPDGPQIGSDAVDRQVHLRHPPRALVELLSVHVDVLGVTPMRLDELLGLHEHAARPTAGVVHPARQGLQHLDQHPHHRRGGVELAAALALGQAANFSKKYSYTSPNRSRAFVAP